MSPFESPQLTSVSSSPRRGRSRSRRFQVLVLAGACAAALPLPSQAQESPRQVIEKTVDAAFAVLRDPSLRSDPKKRLGKLREVVDRAFDWEAMAQSSLGAPWRGLDAGQRNEFVTVFKELLAQRYMDDIDRFQGSEEVKIKGVQESGHLTTVQTLLITASRDQIPIDYTLQKANGKWRVEDVSIERVSLVNHYRKTFARYLNNKSFGELLQQLKRKLGSPSPPVPAAVP